MSRIVIALGGNALGNSPSEQQELVKIPANKIASLIKEGHEVIVGHGNGPQVGMIFNAFQDARKVTPTTPLVPFAEAGGMSQGYIGYHMLTAISNELKIHKIDKDVLYFLTQTIVDSKDPAFKNPTKPVGAFYETKEEAERLNPNSIIIEDAGRGYRKVVPSPKPIDFIGIKAIKQSVDSGAIAIVGGGGGIPTIIENNLYKGVDGVIDKDFALSEIANQINADILVILTAVDYIYINWGKENQKKLVNVSVEELTNYISQDQFAPGSMLPKVQAAINFVNSGSNREAIIADLNNLSQALKGQIGTKIIK